MATLHEFPGMPALTYRVRRRLKLHLRDATLALVLDEPQTGRFSLDEGYSVYIGTELVGRFTVRRRVSLVERNFLCILPESSNIPREAVEEGAFGVAAPESIDKLRTRVEKATVFLWGALDLLVPAGWIVPFRRE